MADTKLTALTELTAPALGDWLYAVDVSDTADDAAGSSRKVLNSTLLQYVPHGLSEISVTGATTATIGRMHVCSGTTADYTLTLPAASGNTGKVIVIRMATGLTKLVTIDGNASETIDGSLTRIMWAGESAILLCDGSNWFKIGGKSIPMSCSMWKAAATTGIVTTTATKISIDTIIAEAPAGQANTGASRIDIKRTAKYDISANGVYDVASGSSSNTQMYGKLNNTTHISNVGRYFTAYGNPDSVAVGYSLTTGDYVELFTYHAYGSNSATFGEDSIKIIEVPQW